MKTLILLTSSATPEMTVSTGYITGAILAILILAYLFYSLFKPEKF